VPVLVIDGIEREVEALDRGDDSRTFRVNGKRIEIEVLKETTLEPTALMVRSGRRVFQVSMVRENDIDSYTVLVNGRHHSVVVKSADDQIQRTVSSQEGPIVVTAPMGGRIASVKIGIGKGTKDGQTLLVLVAMKMENEIVSPKSGVVKEIYVQPGTLVVAGDKLCLVE